MAVLSSLILPCTQGCSLAPIPLVSTYREEIGTGQPPKSTSTNQAHRPQGDSPAINCLNKITNFCYFSCPSAKWVSPVVPDCNTLMWYLRAWPPATQVSFPPPTGLGPIRVVFVSMETLMVSFPTFLVLPFIIPSRIAFHSPLCWGLR